MSSLKSREHDPRQLRVPCIAHHGHTRDLHTTDHIRATAETQSLQLVSLLPLHHHLQCFKPSVMHSSRYFVPVRRQ